MKIKLFYYNWFSILNLYTETSDAHQGVEYMDVHMYYIDIETDASRTSNKVGGNIEAAVGIPIMPNKRGNKDKFFFSSCSIFFLQFFFLFLLRWWKHALSLVSKGKIKKEKEKNIYPLLCHIKMCLCDSMYISRTRPKTETSLSSRRRRRRYTSSSSYFFSVYFLFLLILF